MMTSLHCYKLLVIFIGILVLTACGTISEPIRMYEGTKSEQEIVKFIIPADLDLLKLDEEDFEGSPRISDGQYQLELLPGKHRFKIIYSRMWGSDALGSFVESDAFYFDVTTTAGSVYEFKHNGPLDLSDADNWYDIDDIKTWLEEQKTGHKIKAVSVLAYGNIISRYILGNDKPAKLEAATVKATTKDEIKQAEPKKRNAKELDKLQQKANEQLQFWWKIADQEQRDVFQRWLITLKEVTVAKTTDTMQQKSSEQLKFWWKVADIEQRQLFLLWVKKQTIKKEADK